MFKEVNRGNQMTAKGKEKPIYANQSQVTGLDKALKQATSRADAAIGKLSGRISALEKITTERGLQSLARSHASILKDSNTLHARLQGMILRFTVATEVSFYARTHMPSKLMKLHQACVYAFDEPDSWWVKKEQWTLGEWTEFLAQYKPAHLAVNGSTIN